VEDAKGVESLLRRCSRGEKYGASRRCRCQGMAKEIRGGRVSRSGVLIYRDVSGTAIPSSVSEEMGDTGWLGERAPVIIETVN